MSTRRWPSVLGGFLGAGLLAAVAAACGTGPPASSTPAGQSAVPTSVATAVPSVLATDRAQATPVTNGALCYIEKLRECRLAVGSYTTAPFEHPFSFTIAEVWVNIRASEHGGGLVTTAGSGSFDWASSIETVFPGDVAIGPKADDFVAFLRSVADEPGLTVSAVTDLTIGGLPAKQVDLERVDEAATPVGFSIAEDMFFVEPGGKDRFIVLEVEGSTVVLIIESNYGGAFDDHADRVQPILASIVWR